MIDSGRSPEVDEDVGVRGGGTWYSYNLWEKQLLSGFGVHPSRRAIPIPEILHQKQEIYQSFALQFPHKYFVLFTGIGVCHR
jgi:hypothetical protein